LREGMPGDDHLCRPIRAQPAHRSEPVLELAVISLDRIVGMSRAASASSGVNRCTRHTAARAYDAALDELIQQSGPAA
jgi:hypothetical protein